MLITHQNDDTNRGSGHFFTFKKEILLQEAGFKNPL